MSRIIAGALSARIMSAAFVAGTALAVFATPALAQDLQFRLINASSSGVVEFYVSHSSTDQWEENLIPSGYVLPSGNYIDVDIADGRTTCLYDIKAVFEDSQQLEDFEIDACELGEYTFTD